MKKRLLTIFLCLAMAGSLIACGSSTSTSSTDNSTANESDSSVSEEISTENAGKDSLVVGIPGDPSTFEPNSSFSQYQMNINYQIYDRLYYITKDGEYVYRAAESVEQEDGTHILLKLKKGVTDTNGNELTASDILFDIERLQNNMFASMFNKIDIEASEIVDNYTVRLLLSSPYAIQMNILSNIQLVDEDSFNASSDDMILSPVGFGAYYVDTYTAGSEMVLKARDDWYGGEVPLKTVTVKFITDANQRTNALISGDVDLATEIQISDVDYVDSNDGTYILDRAGFVSEGIVFNCRDISPCHDVHLRRAIAYAINNTSILQVVYKGTASQSIAMYSTGCTDYNSEWDDLAAEYGNYYEYNLEKAKEELAQSSMPNGGTLTGVHYGANNGDNNAELVQSMLAEIGITLNIDAYENATINSMLVNEPEKWDLQFGGWTAGAPFSSEIANIHILSNNFNGWSGDDFEEFRTAVESAEYAESQEECIEKSAEIIRLGDEYVPIYAIADTHYMFGLKEGVNMSFFADEIMDFASMSWS